jgi:16S rRNA processing protein RimM
VAPSEIDSGLDGQDRTKGPDDLESDGLLVIGRLLAPHGVRGWIKFRSFTENPIACFDFSPWTIRSAGSPSLPRREIEVLECREQGELFLLRLAGIDDRDQAQRLSGTDVSVPANSLPELDDSEYYWRELIGMSVRNNLGSSLGQVTDVMNNGAHDILVVRASERERLIPFLAPYLQSVERSTREIVVDWNEEWD